jgi:hypothetical protein
MSSQPDLVVVDASRCASIDSGLFYVDKQGIKIPIPTIECVGAFAWIKVATGTVIAKVTAHASGARSTPHEVAATDAPDLVDEMRKVTAEIDRVRLAAIDAW